MAHIDTFHPEKRTLGVILSSTSPPIQVPDYQRDFSWGMQQTSEFWEDLIAFGGNEPRGLTGKEYFLGAAVMVNNGTFHLLLDGQQRLATATILLAVLRDKISEFNSDAAKQLQDQYITFKDHLTGSTVSKIQLNIFDREFFRDYIQAYPRISGVVPKKKSHKLIKEAYEFFEQKVEKGWVEAGSGKKGFAWAGHIAQTLREHMVLVTVVSNNNKSAASIFATLNDRGIGLSTVDLIRSYILQNAHETEREEIIQCWDSVFTACGPLAAAENFIRISWVAQHGDVKTRSLYKVVSEEVEKSSTPIDYSRRLREDSSIYRQLLDADNDDSDLQQSLKALQVLKYTPAMPILLAGTHKYTIDHLRALAKAIVSIVIRHNIVCEQDRGRLESALYAAAKSISGGADIVQTINYLREFSPSEQQFGASFTGLSFTSATSKVARLMLQSFDDEIATTGEVTVAGAERVHIEHIYPQTPKTPWANHEAYVGLLGNLTLLDKKLNTSIKNADFEQKKDQAYKDSRLEITKELLKYDSWSPDLIEKRQKWFGTLAAKIWPFSLAAF